MSVILNPAQTLLTPFTSKCQQLRKRYSSSHKAKIDPCHIPANMEIHFAVPTNPGERIPTKAIEATMMHP
jgi:hypothetical protein